MQEMKYVHRCSPTMFKVDQGFVEGMHVPGYFYVNDSLKQLVFYELEQFSNKGGKGGGEFIPAIKQLANVAALPGIVKVCITSGLVSFVHAVKPAHPCVQKGMRYISSNL